MPGVSSDSPPPRTPLHDSLSSKELSGNDLESWICNLCSLGNTVAWCLSLCAWVKRSFLLWQHSKERLPCGWTAQPPWALWQKGYMFPMDRMRATSERKLIGSGWYEAEGEEEMGGFPQGMPYLASRNCSERSPVLEWVSFQGTPESISWKITFKYFLTWECSCPLMTLDFYAQVSKVEWRAGKPFCSCNA